MTQTCCASQRRRQPRRTSGGRLWPYTLNYAEALLIAEVQAHLYRFLLQICKQLLLPKRNEWTDEEYSARFYQEFIKSRPYPELLPGASRLTPSDHASNAGATKNLSDRRRYSWYGEPGDLDLQTVGGLIRSRAAEAEDVIRDLRSYPDFFEETVRQWKDVYDQAHPNEKQKGAGEFAGDQLPGWRWAVQKAVISAFKNFDRWIALEECWRSLEIAYRENGRFLSLTNTSPQALAARMAFFRELISVKHMAFTMAETIVSELKAEIFGTVPFGHYFDFKPENDDPDGARLPRRTKVLGDELAAGQGVAVVFERFRAILEDRQRMRFGLSAVLGELDRVIDDENAPENVSFLPAHVKPALEDLGVLAECLIQVENLRPWSSIIHPMMQERPKMSRAIAQVQQLDLPLRRLDDQAAEIFNMTYLRGIPYDNRFEYPAPEVERTREVVNTLKTSGENLDKFWEELLPKLKLREALSVRLQTLLEHKPCHTQPWTISESRPRTGERWQADAETHEAEDSTNSQSLYDEMQARIRLQITASPAASPQREPVRAPAESVQEISSPQLVAADSADNRLRVSTRTMQTLRMLMFDTHRRGPAPGELAWDDLRAAMVDMGFGITAGSGGSEWNFHPGNSLRLASRVPIQFHNPHPKRKLSAKTARRYGRRLCKRYGWTLDSFTER